MALFNNEKQSNSSRRGPSESIALTKGLVAGIWRAEDENGQVRFNWDVSRVSEDGSRTYKTKTVACLLQLPMFTARLCEAFASSNAIPADLREKLAHQAVILGECCSKLDDAHPERKVNGQADTHSVFAA